MREGGGAGRPAGQLRPKLPFQLPDLGTHAGLADVRVPGQPEFAIPAAEPARRRRRHSEPYTASTRAWLRELRQRGITWFIT